MTEESKNERNLTQESDGQERLLRIGERNVRVEYAKGLDGLNAAGTPEIAPTREELLAIARYWAKETLEIDWGWFCTRSTSMSENRRLHSAHSRIAHVAAIVGENEVEKAVDEVYAKFGGKKDKRDWDKFCNGAAEQWESRWDEQSAPIEKALEQSAQDQSATDGHEMKASE